MSDDRYPVVIRLIGVMHKETNKMFMTSVMWSDQSDIIVYRSFQDFKKLHKQLKKRFPPENRFRKSDRLIPRFRARKAEKSFQKKGPNKSMLRLKFLERYCDQLLKSDPSVSQSSEVIQFFLPQTQDLQPDFSKNSIVIMPSEDAPESGGGRSSVGNVTQPFVTEAYRCVAPYETKDTKNRPFKVAVDEKVDVLIKDKAGWWLVENDSKCMAWFPAPYLEKCEEEGDEEDSPDGTEEGVLYCAVKGYKSTKGDEVSMNIGAVVEVLQKSDNGWWLIRYNGKVGYVPSMYLRPYANPQVRFMTLQKEMHSSTLNLAQLQVPGATLSRSQGDLQSAGDPRPGRALPLASEDKSKSRSLDVLSEPRGRVGAAPPSITVEPPSEGWRQDSLSGASEAGSESSLSDDSSAGDPALSLSLPAGDWRLHRSLTPPPASCPAPAEERLVPSRSDPNLTKAPSTPKVPPRPHAQEILTRCTTITRKAAQSPGKARLSLDVGHMQGR
ncbi:hypothetical protein MATL_G00210460 [Megalops atlanticus]|uniref:NADPH oxidase organizer 1 n=1 Tax=Megalops atlanticus TaxID=7932 RepID=A0A9D3PFV0_MEGAT|nr:hypothetical protein MATL_G00210460 [Megalops atlanticus]